MPKKAIHTGHGNRMSLGIAIKNSRFEVREKMFSLFSRFLQLLKTGNLVFLFK
jgi:hypothetical protein